MSQAGYVFAGYAVVLVVLALFAVWVVARGRAMARRVPPQDLPWT